jgi:hypothetical protein
MVSGSATAGRGVLGVHRGGHWLGPSMAGADLRRCSVASTSGDVDAEAASKPGQADVVTLSGDAEAPGLSRRWISRRTIADSTVAAGWNTCSVAALDVVEIFCLIAGR